MVRLEHMGALVAQGRASLVPPALLDRSSAVERRVTQAGVGIADGPSVLVDPASREVVVLGGLAGDAALAVESTLLAGPGRYPLHRIHWSSNEAAEVESAGVGLVRLLNRIRVAGAQMDEATFQHVVALGDHFSPVSTGERGLSDVHAILADLVG